MVGEDQAGKGFKKQLTEIKYSCKGIIPDDMLVRLSRISSDPEQAYRNHDAFIGGLIGLLSPQARLRLAILPG